MQAHGIQHAGAQQLALPDPKSLRILVIDSKAVSRQNTTQLLRECSYQVTAVMTAREGLQLLLGAEHGAGFDLVLKEHDPPGANACRLLKRMAKTEGLTRTPVVVTSTQDERETVMSCLSLGAIDYLIKPLRQNELRHIWTRVWWWRKSQGQHAPTMPSVAVHPSRNYTFRGPSSANRQYEATSSDSKQTNQEEEEPTSKEGSAPDNGNGHGSKGNGSNGSKEGNGTSRVDAKLHCDNKDNGHGSNGNGHGSNNGNGHGSNGNGSNGSSDNKNGGNGNSATKGDGNGNGSNGNGASTTLAVDRHYQALVNTAEGKMPPNLGGHDGLTGAVKGGTTGRSSAFAQYIGPSSSSRKRAATSEAVQPGSRDPLCGTDAMEEDNGTGGSGMPTTEGIATGGGSGAGGGGGASGGMAVAQGRSKGTAQRERERERERDRAAAALRTSNASAHTLSEDTFTPCTARLNTTGRSCGAGGTAGGTGASGAGAGGTGGSGPLSGGGTANNGSSYNNAKPHQHPHQHQQQQQHALSSDRPGSQGISPSHYAGSLQPSLQQQSQQQQHQQQQQQQQVAAAVAAAQGPAVWPGGMAPPHSHAAHHIPGMGSAVTPAGLPGPASFPSMFATPFGLPATHMLPRMGVGMATHTAMRFGPAGQVAAGGGGGHNGGGGHQLGGGLDQHQVALQSIFPFTPPEMVALAAVAASEAHQAAARGPHGSHTGHGGGTGGPHGLLLGSLPPGDGPSGAAAAPTSSATNINAMILNQLLASGVTLTAFLGHQPGPMGMTRHPQQGLGHPVPGPGSRVPPQPHTHPAAALPTHHQQQHQQAAAAAAAVAAAAAAWRPPPFAPASMAAAAAAAAAGVLSFPGSLPPGHGVGPVLPPDHAVAAGLLVAGAADGGRIGRPLTAGMPEPKRRRALALDKYRKKRKNLRFSKTIRYEARKQLAQQRPRVRGQFIKHCGDGGGGSGVGGGGMMDDGAPTVSNGAKSGTGGAGDVAGDDGGGDDEVQTNSRGYYEEEDYDNDDPEEDETEAEPDDLMDLGGGGSGSGGRIRSGEQQQQQQGEEDGSQQHQHLQQPAMEGGDDIMDLDQDAVGETGGSGGGTVGIAGGAVGGSGAGAINGPRKSTSPGPSGGTANAAAAAAALPRSGSCGGPGCDADAEAVVRSLMGLRDAVHIMRVRGAPDHEAAPRLLQEAKASRSVGSQRSLSRDRGHSRGHSHGHSHSQQQQQQSQGHSFGGARGQHVAHSHGHSRPHVLHRQATSAGDGPGSLSLSHGGTGAQLPPTALSLPLPLPSCPLGSLVGQGGNSMQQQQQPSSQLQPPVRKACWLPTGLHPNSCISCYSRCTSSSL
ncbi:hypothetical protein Vafri_9600 [Volvox africanus]|uniref:Pseudo-response regulator 1 n=1 Tax=Volvox africanus TaxID=51714 RepID=A0A8J4F2N9_9CHLO|nr:hypothetical protein Vafri_9600 [Volvox africanus]